MYLYDVRTSHRIHTLPTPPPPPPPPPPLKCKQTLTLMVSQYLLHTHCVTPNRLLRKNTSQPAPGCPSGRLWFCESRSRCKSELFQGGRCVALFKSLLVCLSNRCSYKELRFSERLNAEQCIKELQDDCGRFQRRRFEGLAKAYDYVCSSKARKSAYVS